MALERAELERRKEVLLRELAESQEALIALEDAPIFRSNGLGINLDATDQIMHQSHIDMAEKALEDIDLQLRRMDDRVSEQDDILGRERTKLREERREFWFRRFHLSIGLAHGAGLAAITSKIFDKDVLPATAAGTWWAMAAFAAGLVVAGALPITLYREHHRTAWWMAGVSAVLFVMALGVALSGAAAKAQHVWPFW